MKDKFEQIIKHIPALTLICYICGFVIFKSFLLQYGIIDTDILNIRYLEAGILYLLIVPFILFTPFITNRKLGLLGSICTALLAFSMYSNGISTLDLSYIWKAYLAVIMINAYAFFIWKKHATDKKNNLYDLTESPLLLFGLAITSLITFSIYFERINSNMGGGKNYSKVLILKDKYDNLIKTDSILQTDTLIIIYENDDYIYFKDCKNTKSINKTLVIGEIFIK